MPVFDKYADYYNLLYKDKDYKTEVKYILSLIDKYSNGNANSILNIGCGTGRHDIELTDMRPDYRITGIDISKKMLAIADRNVAKRNLEYFYADARNFDLKKRYDVIISLFHVMSYQTSNNDVINALSCIKRHLKKGGVLIFDFWYGPGVLTQPPSVRLKTLENDKFRIYRFAEPKMLENENIVEVKYKLVINDKKNKSSGIIEELHSMRYFFLPEMEYMLNNAGLKILKTLEWMSIEKELGLNSWYGLIVAKG